MSNASQAARDTKSVIQEFDEQVYSKGNLAAIDALVAKDFRHHAPFPTPQGRDGFKGFISGFREAFPDGTSETHDLIVTGEKAVIRYTFRGTHQGEFMEIPPSGNRVEVNGTSVYRVVDGKVTDEWSCLDTMGMMQQLGAAPS